MRTREWLQSLILGSTMVLVAGCTAHVSVAARGHAVVQSEPAQGAVHAYPWTGAFRPDVGPFVVVYLSTKSDLERLVEKHTHHLYFELLPCSQHSHGPSLFTGTVFEATEVERKDMIGAPEYSDQKLYKVYIPIDLRTIFKQASVQGALDVPSYLETARHDGLCVRIGGGQMWGAALFSNLERVPLVIRDNSLVVASDTYNGV